MLKIKFIESAQSTNDAVREHNEPLTIISAHSQTKGRGQRGNSWESEPYKNLTYSFIITPTFLPFSEQFYISKIVSNALILTLQKHGISSKVKWPNDIYVENKKICGILIENDVTSGGKILRSVVGIGLNVNQTKFLSDAPNPTSMKIITENEHPLEEVINNFAEEFKDEYRKLEMGDIDSIDDFYFDNLYRLNTPAKFKDSDGEFYGEIVAVKTTGELIIEKADKKRKSYLFKEVEYIL